MDQQHDGTVAVNTSLSFEYPKCIALRYHKALAPKRTERLTICIISTISNHILNHVGIDKALERLHKLA